MHAIPIQPAICMLYFYKRSDALIKQLATLNPDVSIATLILTPSQYLRRNHI